MIIDLYLILCLKERSIEIFIQNLSLKVIPYVKKETIVVMDNAQIQRLGASLFATVFSGFQPARTLLGCVETVVTRKSRLVPYACNRVEKLFFEVGVGRLEWTV